MLLKKSNSLRNIIDLQLFAVTVPSTELFTKIVDAVYSAGSKTDILDVPNRLVKNTENAKTILIPKITIDGLRDYSKTSGYGDSSATLEYVSHTFSVDRSASWTLDEADNIETLNDGFAKFAKEFMNTKVIPEVDAYRISKLAGGAESSQVIEENLTKDTAVQSWDTALEVLTNNEVDKEKLIAFVSPTFMRFLKQSNLITRQVQVDEKTGGTINRYVNELDGVNLIEVPQSRMYTEIVLQTGGDSGYVKAVSGKDLNYVICDKSAGMGIKKFAKMKVFTPEVNQMADGYKTQFRIYHDLFVQDNKAKGIYVSHKTT